MFSRCSPTGNADEDKLYLFCPCAADKPGYYVQALAKNGQHPKRCTFPFTYNGQHFLLISSKFKLFFFLFFERNFPL